jgi:formylglycine-generating enzyme required for sulfatase activity
LAQPAATTATAQISEQASTRLIRLLIRRRPPIWHRARFRAKLEPELSQAEVGFRRVDALFRERGVVFALSQLEHAERLAAAGR